MSQATGIESAFRVYAPDECGPDGYPLRWHKLPEPEFSELLNEADLVLPEWDQGRRPGASRPSVRALSASVPGPCRSRPLVTVRSGLLAWWPVSVAQHLRRQRWSLDG